jgi:hypothetical protein
VEAEFDPSAPDVVEEPVEVPVSAEPPLPEVDEPDAPVVAEAELEPDEPVVEAPVPVFVLLLFELPVVAVEPLEVVVEAEPEPDVLVGEGVGVGQVVVLV